MRCVAIGAVHAVVREHALARLVGVFAVLEMATQAQILLAVGEETLAGGRMGVVAVHARPFIVQIVTVGFVGLNTDRAVAPRTNGLDVRHERQSGLSTGCLVTGVATVALKGRMLIGHDQFGKRAAVGVVAGEAIRFRHGKSFVRLLEWCIVIVATEAHSGDCVSK